MPSNNKHWADSPLPPLALTKTPIGPVAQQTAKDAQHARTQTAFDPMAIENIIRDGRIDNETRREVIGVMRSDPVFNNLKKRLAHMNREQVQQASHFACRRILNLAEQHGWSTLEIVEAVLSLDLQSPISIHWIAFVPVIMSQGTPDQIDRWAGRAMRHEIMGAYLQTELGHGSNVAGLETTATFDKSTDSFIIHSPTLTSTKWWAGGLGTTATHAVVQAQLLIDGKDIGPHLFFVPLRSVETGELFPGVNAGDIGPKAYGAFAGLDNGWARFDHYKIPRENMFMKHSQVSKDGVYTKPPSAKMSYLGMMFIRSQMIDRCGWMLSRGITIAIRYSSVRRQFRDPDSSSKADSERAVISYPSLNRKLLPMLAQSYAFILAGRRMQVLYEELSEQLEKGDTTLLADTHVASSSLKAYCTDRSLEGIEACRQALGGHGFSTYSGFSTLFADNAPTVIYEGHNSVLAQQVGRAMLKISSQLEQDPKTPVTNTTSFLRALDTPALIPFEMPRTPADWRRKEVYTAALQLRAAALVAGLRAEMYDAPSTGSKQAGGRRFVDLSWECQEVARSHAEVSVHMWFSEAVEENRAKFGKEASGWIDRLVDLNALHCLSRNITPLVLSTPSSEDRKRGRALAGTGGKAFLDSTAVVALDGAIRELVEELLPQAIGLTDAFGWSDWELNSDLGRRDGRVYENLMADAEANPLNHPSSARASEAGLEEAREALGPELADVGVFCYGRKEGTGKHVVEWYGRHIRPLLKEAAERAGDGGIEGDGSKL
ncbi:hypothetical protein CF327_g3188 [Tilletia walkeri]|nr:hypothetical protein CF327_g3188 [Tilletia walkeri]